VPPKNPGLKSWAGGPCPYGTADRFSAVEEEILFSQFDQTGPPAQGFIPGGGKTRTLS
jgi:hypothetical protein